MIQQTVVLDTPLLRQLVRTGKAGALVARGVPGGFLLAMREGIDEYFDAEPGDFLQVRVVDADEHDLYAEVISE